MLAESDGHLLNAAWASSVNFCAESSSGRQNSVMIDAWRDILIVVVMNCFCMVVGVCAERRFFPLHSLNLAVLYYGSAFVSGGGVSLLLVLEDQDLLLKLLQ